MKLQSPCGNKVQANDTVQPEASQSAGPTEIGPAVGEAVLRNCFPTSGTSNFSRREAQMRPEFQPLHGVSGTFAIHLSCTPMSALGHSDLRRFSPSPSAPNLVRRGSMTQLGLRPQGHFRPRAAKARKKRTRTEKGQPSTIQWMPVLVCL